MGRRPLNKGETDNVREWIAEENFDDSYRKSKQTHRQLLVMAGRHNFQASLSQKEEISRPGWEQ